MRSLTLSPAGGHGHTDPRPEETPRKFVARTETETAGAKRAHPVEEVVQTPPVKRAMGKPVFDMSDGHALVLAMLLGATILVTMYMGRGGSL